MNNQNNQSTLDLIKTTFSEWNDDNASRLAAALAYYTIFSIAPLLVIAVAVAGVVLGRGTAREQLVQQIQSYTGDPQAAEFIQRMIESTSQSNSGLFATIAGVIGLLFGASGVFAELQSALNQIWDVEAKPSGVSGMIFTRLIALAMVLLCGLLLLASVVLTTAITAAAGWLNQLLPGVAVFIPAISFVVLLVLTVLIFALIYKYLPDTEIAWNDVWIGAIATALLFSIGRYLIGLYLGYSSAASTYGAAGSLALLLLWIYYSAQIFFLGAEFTQVYSRTHGSRQHDWANPPGDEAQPSQQEIYAAPEGRREQTATGRSVARPLVNLATTVGAIAVLSLFNFIRTPFRK